MCVGQAKHRAIVQKNKSVLHICSWYTYVHRYTCTYTPHITHPPTSTHNTHTHTHTHTAHTQIARSAHKHKPTRTCAFVQVKSQVLCARRKIGQAGPVTCRIRSGRAGQQALQNKPGRSSRAVLHSGPVKPGGFWWDPGQAARPGPMPSLMPPAAKYRCMIDMNRQSLLLS